jgi:hypothetical protein
MPTAKPTVVLWLRAAPAERSVRQQEQTVSIKRFGEDLITLQQRIDAEKLARDAELNTLRGEVHDALGNRNLGDEQFRVRVGLLSVTCTCIVYLEQPRSRMWAVHLPLHSIGQCVLCTILAGHQWGAHEPRVVVDVCP